jgi:hypothetical protein
MMDLWSFTLTNSQSVKNFDASSMLAFTTCWNSSNVQLYVETMQMFILLSLLVNAERLTNLIYAASTETVPMRWREKVRQLYLILRKLLCVVFTTMQIGMLYCRVAKFHIS